MPSRRYVVRIRMPVLMSPFEREHSDRAAVPAARVLLQILDGLRRRLLGRADHGHRPHVGEKRIERIEALLQDAFHVIHRVEHAGVAIRSAAARSPSPCPARRRATCRCGPRPCTWSARILPWCDFSSSRMLSASRSGSPVRCAVPEIGQVSTRVPSTRTNISGDAPTSCSSPNCRRNSYGLGLAVCTRSKQLARPCRSMACGRSGAAPLRSNRRGACPRAPSPRWPCTLRACGRRRSGPAARRRGGAICCAVARQASGGDAVALEIVLEALDLLLLAIHEPDVVAEKQVQILVAVARQLLLDRLELEQQVVAEGAHQARRESSSPRNSSISARRIENAEGCLLRSSSGNSAGSGFSRPASISPSKPNSSQCGWSASTGWNRRSDLAAARIERAELEAPVVGDDFQRRAGGGDIPARVSPGILVSRGKIDPTVVVQIAQKVRQPLPEIGLRNGAGDLDPVGSRIAVFAHSHALWGIISQNSMRARISPPICAAGFRSWPDALHREDLRVRRNLRDRRAQFLDRRERIARAVDEQRGRAQLRKECRAQLLGLARRMQRIGEQQQAVGQIGMLGRGHRGLPSAVGMPSREDAPRRVLPHAPPPPPARLRDRAPAPAGNGDPLGRATRNGRS